MPPPMAQPHSWSPSSVCNYVDSSGRENICPRFRENKLWLRSTEKSWLRLRFKAARALCDALLKGRRESSHTGKAREGHHERAEMAVSLSQVSVCEWKLPHRYCDRPRQGICLEFQGMA